MIERGTLRNRATAEDSVRQETEHRPTKFAYLGVGQAVLPNEISLFATELFPAHEENIPEVLTQAQQIAIAIHEQQPAFNLPTDLFHPDSPSFQRTDFIQLGTLELCAEAVDVARLEQDGVPIVPEVFGGHSLGAVFVAYLAGAISRKPLREIGAFRGRVMQEAYEKTHTTLVSVQGLSEEAINDLLPSYAKVGLINAPTLIAIGLPEARVEEFQYFLKRAGAKKVVPLGTKGAFHVAIYMEEAAEKMDRFLGPYDFMDLSVGEFVANSDGRRLTRGKDIKEELVSSMLVPVRYPDMLRNMSGVDGFIEIGPGKVLAGLNNLNGIPKSHSLHIRNYFK